MWELSHRSAVTRCEYVEGGVVLARHTGVVGHAEVDVIVPRLAASYANGILERYDTAVTLFTQDAATPAYRVPAIPWALIVRDEFYEQATKFCAYLATCGVMRTAWRSDHAELALRWCLVQSQHLAAVQGAKLGVVSLPGRPATGETQVWTAEEDRAAWPQKTLEPAQAQRQ